MNLIFQILINDPNLNRIRYGIYRKCCTTIRRYAENIGCDYIIESEQFLKQYPPHFEIFRILAEEKFDAYDKILFVDADVFGLNTTDNIFDYYDTFSACKNPGTAKRTRPEFAIAEEFLNSGIVLFDKETREKLKPLYVAEMDLCKRVVPGRDQLALNKLAYNHLGGYTKINPKHACYLRDDEAKEAILVHMAGRNRQLYLENPTMWDEHFEL